ncbi:MAG: hypothetical protein JXR80_07955 [Deltaproteobacteria bacterium]|nr:hypothetical protein [Deltaproteobacteria bacterium]
MPKITLNLFKNELWRRAARHFAKAGHLTESADAWLAAGHNKQALNTLLKAGDRARVTPLLIREKRYKEAADLARLWLEELSLTPKRRAEEEIAARLNLAAALHFDRQRDQAQAAYEHARENLIQLNSTVTPLTEGKNWEALAAYGVLLKRPDLIRLGYEKALAAYGPSFNLQRLRSLGEYLEKVEDDLLLTHDLKERRAAWQPQSSLKRERERLWQALSEFTA